MDPFEFPEDIAQVEDLEAELTRTNEASQEIIALEDPSEDDLALLERLADHADAIRAEAVAREEGVAERQARRDRAAARLAGEIDASEDAPEGDSDDEDGDGADTPDEGEQPAEGAPAPETGDQPEQTQEQPQQVAASGRGGRRRAPNIVRSMRQPANPTPRRTDENGVSIVASAGTGREAGSRLPDLNAVVEAFQQRSRSFPQGHVPNTYIDHAVATFSRGDFGGLSMDNPEYAADQQALLDAAGNERRLPNGGNLAAAGGWCAPSETFYDLVAMETTDGLVDLPEVQVRRGGMRFTTGPDFADIYTNSGFSQTEAQAIAGTTKPCYEVDCPDFEEVRLDAVGFCVKAPLLTNAAYPELVRRTLAGVLVAHQHKVSIRMLTSMGTLLGTAVTVPNSGSVSRSTLTGLELAAEGQRAAYRLAQDQTLEVILPHWLRLAMRDDLQTRLRSVEPVTDAQLDAHFAARNLRVQFVYGFGDARIVSVPGGGTCLVDFPDTAPAYIYPAGTFVKGTADVISLDTVYDTTDLQSNVYTAAFVEEGVLLAQRAPGGCRLTLPVNSTGRVGAADLTAAYGATDA